MEKPLISREARSFWSIKKGLLSLVLVVVAFYQWVVTCVGYNLNGIADYRLPLTPLYLHAFLLQA